MSNAVRHGVIRPPGLSSSDARPPSSIGDAEQPTAGAPPDGQDPDETLLDATLLDGEPYRTQRKHAERKVREAEARYRTLVEQLPAVVYIDSLEGPDSTLYISPRLEEMLGFTPEEWVADPNLWSKLLHPDDRDREIAASTRHHLTGEPYRGEYRMFTKSGDLKWFLEEAMVLRDEEGQPLFCQGVLHDITEQKRAEAELHAAEAKYRGLVEHVPAVFFVDLLDDDLTTIYVSPQIESILGLTPHEYLARPGAWFQHLHPEDRERAREIYLAGRTRGKPFSYEYRMVRPDGRTIWINEVAVVLRDAAGRPNMIQGAMFDITGRKRAEWELEQRNELLATLQETALGMMNRLELDDLLQAIVARAGALVGTPHGYIYVAEPGEKELVVRAGTGVFQAHQGFRLRPGEGLGGRVWQSGEPLRIDDYDAWEGRSPAFPFGVFRAAAGVPLKSGGRVVGALGLTRDEPGRTFTDEDVELLQRFAELASIALDNAQLYTERKGAEETLRQALEREKEISNRLRDLDEMKNTLLHAVSHELRTPLAAVLGFALTLEREDVKLAPEESRDLVRRLAGNARKLDRLLTDLLDLDRLDQGILEPSRHPTDVGALVRRVVEGSDVLGERPIRVEADLVIVSVDGPKVERIVENLLANAARHTPPHSTIWVRVTLQAGGVLLAVEDEGPGIPTELREEIFEPFHRGPEPAAGSPGVGVGLSLVTKFAGLHGGRAWVEDRPGGGASFRVFLPGAAP